MLIHLITKWKLERCLFLSCYLGTYKHIHKYFSVGISLLTCELHPHIPHSLQCRRVGPSFLGSPLLVSSGLDFGSRGPALPSSSSSPQGLLSFLPARSLQMSFPKAPLQTCRSPSSPKTHQTLRLPQWLRNRRPLRDRAQLALSCLPHTCCSTPSIQWRSLFPEHTCPSLSCLCAFAPPAPSGWNTLYDLHLHLPMSCP